MGESRDEGIRRPAGSPGPSEVRRSICTICETSAPCGLDCHVRDGRVVKVEGTKGNPHNAGTLCSKGAAMRQYLYHPDRLTTPLKRIGPKGTMDFAPVSWGEAMDLLAGQLLRMKAEHGAESVVFFAGFSKWMRPFLQRLAHSFGSPNFCTESSTCHLAVVMAWKLVFGQAAVPDIRNAKCLLVWSKNPFHSDTASARGLLDAKEKGLKIIAVDPRISPMAGTADIHLRLRPGTDGALALAMANVIVSENLYDQDFVARYTHGFPKYREYIREFTPERTEVLTGVPASLIRAAARMYATTKPAAFLPSASPVVHHTNGVQNYRAAMSLIGLTGNYDVVGGNRVLPPSYLYTAGTGFPARQQEYARSRAWADMATRIGADAHPVWAQLTDEAQAVALPAQIRTARPYPVKGMLAFGINHRMWPDSEGMAAALEQLDFLCNVELFLTDTCRAADLVLPACTSLERSELRIYPERFALLTQPVVEPVGESRPDVDIIFDLAQRLELDDPLLKSGYEASLDWMLEPSGVTVEDLRKHPNGLPAGGEEVYCERKYRDFGFPTPSGKMEFVSSVLSAYSHLPGHDALPVYYPPKHSPEATPELAKDFPFILNTGSRLPMFVHSRTFRLPWTRSLRPVAAADINPKDAARLKIGQGDLVRISTPKSSITVEANPTEIAAPGVVHMYHAYPEADVNTLIEADYVDPISGFPGFKSLLCSLERVAGGSEAGEGGGA